MSVGRRIRWICLLLLICVFSKTVDFLILRGDVTYRLWSRLRPHSALALQKTEVDELRSWTLAELEDEGIVASNLLMLVSADHPLPRDYEAILAEYNGARMHPEMVAPYIALRDTVEAKTGVRIYVSSDFRSAEEQEAILAESPTNIAAPVGGSEHEAGLALDVYAPYFAGEEFIRSAAGRAVGELCADYGFIIRYPLGGEDVTGIVYEPWHLRYVGAPHAELMSESGMLLEEYIQALAVGQWYSYGDYLICRQSIDNLLLPATWSDVDLSLDNTGYCIVTVKR